MSRPPHWLEGLVRALLPPVCREHVLGDLSERYRSPGRYLADALSALPGLIASQVRRTLVWLRLLLLGVLLFAVLGEHAQTPLAAVLPTLLALAGLTLRDAYRLPQDPGVPGVPPASEGLFNVLAVVLPVLLYQALAATWVPAWELPPSALRIGLPAFCALLFLLSLMWGPLNSRAGLVWPPRVAVPMSAAEVLNEARGFEATVRRQTRMEQGGALITAAGMLAAAIGSPLLTVRIAAALAAAGALCAVVFLQRQLRSPRPLAEGMGFSECVAVYRGRLERRRRTVARLWLYQLPLLVGPGLVMLAVFLEQRTLWPPLVYLITGVLMAVFLVFVWASRITQQPLQCRLDQLARMTERQP